MGPKPVHQTIWAVFVTQTDRPGSFLNRKYVIEHFGEVFTLS